MTTATRITIPSAIKASIWALLMNGTPRKRVLEWVHDTATGKTTPNTYEGDQLAIFGMNSVNHVSALLDYARNLRPNRKPDAEKARKAKYTGANPATDKVVGYAFLWTVLNELGTRDGQHGSAVAVYPDPNSVVVAGIARLPSPANGRVVKLRRVPQGASDVGAILAE